MKASKLRRVLMLAPGLVIAGLWSGPGVADHGVFDVAALQDNSAAAREAPVTGAHGLARFRAWLREAITEAASGAKPAAPSRLEQ